MAEEKELPVMLNLEESGMLCHFIMGQQAIRDALFTGRASPPIARLLRLYKKLARVNDTLMGKIIVEEPPGPTEEERKRHLLAYRIDQLELSVRTSNCLSNAGIFTVEQLIKRSRADLLQLKHFGRRSLNELLSLLHDVGLRLADEEPALERTGEPDEEGS